MTPELASFSDWTLALLPRLFLYPGGLCLLVALLALRFVSGVGKSVALQAGLVDLSRANLLSIAVAWVALALAPFPGAATLPSPVDGLVLAALLALSLLLDTAVESGGRRAEKSLWAAGAITLALVLPAIESGSLLVQAGGSTLFLAASSLAVTAGLLALCWEDNGGIAGEVRWLAWFCLGVVPLWQRFTGDNPLAASLFVLAGVGILNEMRNAEFGMRNILTTDDSSRSARRSTIARVPLVDRKWIRNSVFRIPYSEFATLVIAWLLALLGLLWALLAAA